jgi:hypothetical protein
VSETKHKPPFHPPRYFKYSQPVITKPDKDLCSYLLGKFFHVFTIYLFHFFHDSDAIKCRYERRNLLPLVIGSVHSSRFWRRLSLMIRCLSWWAKIIITHFRNISENRFVFSAELGSNVVVDLCKRLRKITIARWLQPGVLNYIKAN